MKKDFGRVSLPWWNFRRLKSVGICSFFGKRRKSWVNSSSIIAGLWFLWCQSHPTYPFTFSRISLPTDVHWHLKGVAVFDSSLTGAKELISDIQWPVSLSDQWSQVKYQESFFILSSFAESHAGSRRRSLVFNEPHAVLSRPLNLPHTFFLFPSFTDQENFLKSSWSVSKCLTRSHFVRSDDDRQSDWRQEKLAGLMASFFFSTEICQ